VDDEALFDDDVTVLTDEARAACAAAFAEVFAEAEAEVAEAEAEEVREIEVSLRDEPERPLAATPCRVAGFYEAMRMSVRTTTTPEPLFEE
jgi:hypothetical protein